MLEVVDGGGEIFYLILEKAETTVAVGTQQSSDLIGFVTVIHMQLASLTTRIASLAD
jgi:hypothetical protein